MNNTIKIFTDGSGSTLGYKAGAWCAVITLNDNPIKITYGGMANITIGIAEMMGIITALEYVRSVPELKDCEIEVFCDRQDVVLSATGQYSRKANKLYWKRFDTAAKGLNLTITHVPRNTSNEQSKCDEICGEIRKKIELNPNLKINTDEPIH